MPRDKDAYAPPTVQDLANTERRQAIAERHRAEYQEALALATAVFGEGWLPHGRHILVSHDEEDRVRRSGEPMKPAATVYSVHKDGVKQHFTVRDGQPVEVAGLEEGFGNRLNEPDPDRGFMLKGRFVRVHRYSLYWAGYEPDYRPKSAEQLAAARHRREQKAVEAEAKGNLFADLVRAEGYVAKPPGKPR